MNRKITTLLIGGLLLASCAMEDVTETVTGNEEAVPVTATIGTETKTHLGPKEDNIYKVLWSQWDNIAIRTDGAESQAVYTALEGGDVTAVFIPEDPTKGLKMSNGAIAVYPAENAEIVSTKEVYITIPAEQVYAEGSFAEEAMPMVSNITAIPEFRFFNAAGALKLMVSTNKENFKVKSVTVATSEGFISGKCRYDVNKKEYVAGTAADENKVVLDCGNGVAVGRNATAFYIVVPHREYEDLCISIQSTDGREQKFNLKEGKKLAVGRSSILSIPLTADEMAEPARASIDIAWSYKYGDTWKHDNGISTAMEFKVSGIDDITKLKDADGKLFSPLTSTIKLKATATDSKGKTYDATAIITSLSKNDVRLTGGNIPFAKGEVLNYQFTAKLYDDEPVEYTIKFDINTGAMPEDKTITLDDLMIDGRMSSTMYGEIKPFAATLAVDKDFYPEALDEDESEAFIKEFFKQTSYTAGTLVAEVNGKPVSGPGFRFAYDSEEEIETSYISIPAGIAEYDDKVVMLKTMNIFGVNYSYLVTAKISRLGFSIERNPVWVNPDNTVNLEGTVKIPNFIKGTGTTDGADYQLSAIDLRDYVIVNGENEKDIYYNELSLLYKVTTVKYDEYGKVEKSGDDFATLNTHKTYTTDDPHAMTNLLTWNTADEDAIYRNSLDVEIELVATGDTTVSYGSIDLTLVVPELVRFSKVKPDKTKKQGAYSVWEDGEWSYVNVVSALSAFDAATSAELYNKYAYDITEFWMGYEYSDTGKIYYTRPDEDDSFRVYGQTDLEIDTEHITAVMETSGVEVPAMFYDVNPETGEVKLLNNSGGITDNVIVKIPVSFKHNYCGETHTQIAEVKFYKN